MRKIYLVSLSIIAVLLISLCSNFSIYPEKITIKQGDNYKSQWKKVDDLEKKGLPKSAIKIVDKIYESAKIDTNTNQIIKAFIFKMKFNKAVEESAFENSIYDLQEEINAAQFPEKNIMQSMLAEMYWMYYRSNRWKFKNRSQTVGFANKDIKTWDLNTLADKVIKNYRLSLENTNKLKLIAINDFEVLIKKGENTKGLRPTLYDFLAQRAVSFFKNKEITLSKPADFFQLKEDFYFADAKEFANAKVLSNDTLSLQFYGVQILQELIKFHLSDKNPNAFIDLDLQRLDFGYANSVNPNKNKLYKNALTKLLERYKNIPVSSEISYRLGMFFKNKIGNYNATDSLTEKYKDNNKIAHKIFSNAISAFPKSDGSLKCKYEKNIIEKKSLNFTTDEVIVANEDFLSLVKYKNIDTLYSKVVKINFDDYKISKSKFYGKDLYLNLLKKGTEISKNKHALPVDKDFNSHSVEMSLNKLDLGFYLLIVSNNKDFSRKNNLLSYSTIRVSNLTFLSKNRNGKIEFYVLNRKTGNAEVNVKADIFKQKYDYKTRAYVKEKLDTKYSDKDGFFSINANNNNKQKNIYVELYKNQDFLPSDNSFYLYNNHKKEKEQITNHLFTDRAIYRPGQTVYFKGISITQQGDKKDVFVQHPVNVEFLDVNRQKISSLKLVSNEFGTFNGSFQIPTGILNGRMQIKTKNGSTSIRVEEYKRPKFETKILPFKNNYRLNDVVEVQGQAIAFSGANVTEATVKYRVVRTPVWRHWWWNRNSPNVEIENGTVQINDNGIYTIKFKAIPNLEYKKSDGVDFNYTIYADVTDLNGETQSTSKNIKIGYVDLNLSVNIPKELKIESSDTFKISTTNLNGEFVKSKGQINIYKLHSSSNPLKIRLWNKPDKYLTNVSARFKNANTRTYKIEKEVSSHYFDTEKRKDLVLGNLKKWKTGYYKLVISSTDAYGSKVKHEQYFILFKEKTKKMPFADIFWKKSIKVLCEPGENARIIVGSSKKVKMLFEISQNDNTIEKSLIDINNEQKTFVIPIKEKYRGNINVSFDFVYDNKHYSYNQTVVVPFTNKKLDVEFQTFRNKLLPGEKEKWLMTIKGKTGDAAMAEMMATLYDKSLDQFAVNYWKLNLWNANYSSNSWSGGMFGTLNSKLLYKRGKTSFSLPIKSYDSFNWFGFNYYYNTMRMFSRGSKHKSARYKGSSSLDMATAPEPETLEMINVNKVAKKTIVASDTKKDKNRRDNISEEDRQVEKTEVLSQIKARTNFNETAFFYPELRTNEKGELVVEFTVPESLTTWKMMGLAITKDLKIGYVENQLITQKSLMVVPNAPRFFREGDEISFPLKISNITDKEMTVDYDIQFFNAITDKQILLNLDSEKTSLIIPAKGNKSISISLIVPENVDAIKYRVVAKSGAFSDAEENVVPVLNNRMLVTESLPLPIRGNETKTFNFDKLKNNKSTTLKNYKYTLEFTSNPVWYAIQTLPYLMEYSDECAEQIFSKFYANSLASNIANSSPKIKAVFDSWKNTAKSEALLSNLEKNQELKALMLEETPWVLDGKNESERKARIGLLFDLNKMSNEQAKALKKLKTLQTSNGGWTWFKGMPDDRYITQYIISGMGHLDHLQVKDLRENNSTWRMITTAVKYLDDKISEDYKHLQRYAKTEKEMAKQHIGNLQIQYLYARSFFPDIVIGEKNKKAYDYYFAQAKKYWLNQSKYQQAMIALTLYRSSETKTGMPVEQEIMKSLKENSITNDELGMYWKDNTAGYYWSQAPVETQALMIEAFTEVAKDKKSVEELKIWLLKQKQTQNWKTTKATVEAIYALLLNSTNATSEGFALGGTLTRGDVEIKIGNKTIDPKKIDGVKVEAGTGYFKTSWRGKEITSDMGDITLTKKDDGIAWGAVYWQYFEQLDKITKHKTPLYLVKKLFVEKLTKSGKIIEPITKNKIKIGDKIIVRIELRVDRDMEYVHMKDMRASGFEPMNVVSKFKYQDGLGYYETTKDASTNFFMDKLRKGTYVFEYPVRVTHKGDFSNGITTIQCMYAPEFTSHSEGVRVLVE